MCFSLLLLLLVVFGFSHMRPHISNCHFGHSDRAPSPQVVIGFLRTCGAMARGAPLKKDKKVKDKNKEAKPGKAAKPIVCHLTRSDLV